MSLSKGTYDVKEWVAGENNYGICRLIDCRWITQIGINQQSIILKDLSYHGSQVYALPTNRRIRAFGELHITTQNGNYFVADSLDILK